MCALLIKSSCFHSRASPGKLKVSGKYENSLTYFPICLCNLPKPNHRSFINNITNLHRPEQTAHHFARQSRTTTSCHLCCRNALERNSTNVIEQKPGGSPEVQTKKHHVMLHSLIQSNLTLTCRNKPRVDSFKYNTLLFDASVSIFTVN